MITVSVRSCTPTRINRSWRISSIAWTRQEVAKATCLCFRRPTQSCPRRRHIAASTAAPPVRPRCRITTPRRSARELAKTKIHGLKWGLRHFARAQGCSQSHAVWPQKSRLERGIQVQRTGAQTEFQVNKGLLISADIPDCAEYRDLCSESSL
eukprot:s8708_g2.t1